MLLFYDWLRLRQHNNRKTVAYIISRYGHLDILLAQGDRKLNMAGLPGGAFFGEKKRGYRSSRPDCDSPSLVAGQGLKSTIREIGSISARLSSEYFRGQDDK